MSDFTPGFVARVDGVADALKRAFGSADAFTVRTIVPDAPVSTPRHFSPETPGHRATDGWDMFDPKPVGPMGAMRDPLDPLEPPDINLDLDLGADPTNDGAFGPVAPADLMAELNMVPVMDVATTLASDSLEAVREAAYAEGLAAGRAESDASLAQQVQLLTQIRDAVNAGAQIDRAMMANHMRQTVLHLVTKIVGEAQISPEFLSNRIQAAVDLLADTHEAAVLRMHADDVAMVQADLPSNITAVADAERARGSFLLESTSTLVEDGCDIWLAQLAGAIDRVPLPTGA